MKINKLAPEGITMYAKAEFFNPCSSVKDRCVQRAAIEIHLRPQRPIGLFPESELAPRDCSPHFTTNNFPVLTLFEFSPVATHSHGVTPKKDDSVFC